MRTGIVYGGNGALGSAILKHLKSEGWTTISVDAQKSPLATHSVELDISAGLKEQGKSVLDKLRANIDDAYDVDAIICAAGGWAGGNAGSESLFDSVEAMYKQSVYSSVVASHVASKKLKNDDKGLLVLVGAAPAVGPTPGMIGYGVAKAAVHHLAKSMADTPSSGLPEHAKVVALLPVTLDTPGNRTAMPTADTTTWTPLADVAEQIVSWCKVGLSVPSGSLVKVATKNGKTSFTVV
ncbi:hypothetical protein H4219_005188 [Mycoemilia scoparia]|uniref:Dihydropteridine reductase n=1 Tax=Mycoemilia scoparia TaxID=417184 RepID=A0A9W7ZQ13_9FUNG|nr:hypothetical protein H4219_005188 [Mycoemilia scoparia]